jgi:transcription termination/antitermination protein NusA
MTTTPIPTNELVEQIKSFVNERGLSYEEVMVAIERAIAGAYRREFGDKDKSYTAEFNPDTNKYHVYETMRIVDVVENPLREISIVDARLDNPQALVGDEIKHDLDVEKEVGFGRIASQVAKQVLVYTVNNFRHTKVLTKYKDFVGKIVPVEVDAFKRGGYLVKIGHGNEQTMGYIMREDLLMTDRFKPGQIIKVLIKDITEDENKSSKIQMTRSAPEFVTAIIAKEVPEVENGLVKIDKIVREPGNRTKLLVSVDETEDLDPVGTILGRRNVRLLNIMREISTSLSEKIDVIESQPNNLEEMVMDALEPAQVERVEFGETEDGHKLATVYCLPDEASLAVGRRGANVRLAGQLLDIEIKIQSLEGEEAIAARPEIVVE